MLGVAGALVTTGYGYYEVSQGKTVDGILDAGAGIGTALIATAAGSASIPGPGWVVAGICVAGKAGYDIYAAQKEKNRLAPLEIA